MSDIETLRIMHNEVAKVANQVQTVVDDLKWLFEYNAIDAPAAYEDVRREIGVKLINALGKVNALPTFTHQQ